MVGTVRFELTASCSQSRRANQTTLRPEKLLVNNLLKISKEIQQLQNAYMQNVFFGLQKRIKIS
jgi:hypothetical protein